VADKDTEIENWSDRLRLNHQFSVTQDWMKRLLDRQVEGMFMGSILPAFLRVP
jgi:hypothetical protein